MSTREQMKFYNDDKYWNMDLKDDFMNQTRTLWRGNFNDKRAGSIFTFESKATPEQNLIVSEFFIVLILKRWTK